MNPTGARAYLQTKVTTTTPGDLVVLLFDGAIKFLKQAKGKIQERDMAAKGILISKAIDIIGELDGSLNAQKGGDLAKNLHKLYFYCNTRLLKANMLLDVSLIDEVIHILTGLGSAFREIASNEKAGLSGQVGHPMASAVPTYMPQPEAQPEPQARAVGYADQLLTRPTAQPAQARPAAAYATASAAAPAQTMTATAPRPPIQPARPATPPVQPAQSATPTPKPVQPAAAAPSTPAEPLVERPAFKPMSAAELMKRKITAAYR